MHYGRAARYRECSEADLFATPRTSAPEREAEVPEASPSPTKGTVKSQHQVCSLAITKVSGGLEFSRTHHCMRALEQLTSYAVVSGMVDRISRLLTEAGGWLARPHAFVAVLVYVALWLIFDRGTLSWHELATVATLFMTLFIQRSEHRDMQAVQAKLDELLRAHGEARTELSRIDNQEPEQVEAFREKAQAGH